MAQVSNNKLMKKLSFVANTFLFLCVVGMLAVYNYYHVSFMVYLSIPVLVLYVLYFALISINRVAMYFWFVYATIGIYMCAATLCLGINFGFNLYCMSLIPIGFFCQYLGHKMSARQTKIKTGYASIGLIILYFVSIGITLYNGPLYEIDHNAEMLFYLMNSLFVFAFLVFYSRVLINLVMETEEKLEHMALYDNLTGLYNRHYLMDSLREMESVNTINWIAILDVDKFKSVNDIYGHSAGDTVLKEISKIMLELFHDTNIGRWGGEEFILVPCSSDIDESILETLRQKVENTEFHFEDQTIKVTISIGAAYYSSTNNLEKCINEADKCLYTSKNSGRNRVTWEKK